MRNKFLSILVIMLVVLVTFTNVNAADGMFHMGAYSDIYKLSEEADIDLPFINVFTKAATYDKAVTHSGISIGDTTIDVNEKLEGMQVLVSTDMVNIKGEVENSFIYANNVVIEGRLTGDTIIFAPTVQILKGAVVEKDVIIVANNLDIQGTVKGNVIATVSETAKVSGVINKDLRIITQELALENEKIKGDIYIETNADMSSIKEKYPKATVKTLTENVEDETDWMGIITKGIITVVVYSGVCFFIIKKENNIVTKAYNKFKGHTMFGLVASLILIMALLILPIVLILLAVFGLGIVAWPILIAYLALMLFVISTAMLIVGATTFEAIKVKVDKFKIPAIALIFAVLYTLTQISGIAAYVNMAMFLIALGIIVTTLVKKDKVEDNK